MADAIHDQSASEAKNMFNLDQWKALGHTARRKFCKKRKRHYSRSTIAQQIALEEKEEREQLENQPGYWEKLKQLEKDEEDRERREEVERQYQHELWLRREMLAQMEFRKKRQQEDAVAAEKEERERMIKEEWETLKAKEWEEEERKRKNKMKKEALLQEALSVSGQDGRTAEQPWHNPLPPEGSANRGSDRGTEQDVVNCAFYLKTGACRFGDRCSRAHPRLSSSTTLLIPHMFHDIALAQQVFEDKDTDISLEFEESDMYDRFKEFYFDVLSEFEKVGKVIQFKVCCNQEPHLRGNVYVQYTSEEDCAKTFQAFNGRWYSARQLSCQYCPVQKWRTAICGQFLRKCCPKGKNCNFLHVFRNPNNAFWQADTDQRRQYRDVPRSDRRDSVRSWRDGSARSYRMDSRDSTRSHKSSRASSRHSSRSPRASSRHSSRSPRASSRHSSRSPRASSRHSSRTPRISSRHSSRSPRASSHRSSRSPRASSRHCRSSRSPRASSRHSSRSPRASSHRSSRSPRASSHRSSRSPRASSRRSSRSPRASSRHSSRSPRASSRRSSRSPQASKPLRTPRKSSRDDRSP